MRHDVAASGRHDCGAGCEHDDPGHDPAQGTSRRGFLRSGLKLGAVGLAATVGSTLLVATAQPAAAADGYQSDWAYCNKCQCLYYAGFGTRGKCVTGGHHAGWQDGNYSYDYRVYHGSNYGNSFLQPGWAYCPRCESMTYAAQNGWCVGSRYHVLEGASLPYCMWWNVAPSTTFQPGWKFCNKCGNLAYAGAGPCAGGGSHAGLSYNYGLLHY